MSALTETTAEKKHCIRIGKFNGAFAQFQSTAYFDLKAAGFDARLAHLVADDYGSDIGNAVRNGSDFGSKIAKAKKDGTAKISITGKGASQMSNTMALLRVVQVIDGLIKEKLLTSRTVNRLHLNKDVQEYLERKESHITQVDWTDE